MPRPGRLTSTRAARRHATPSGRTSNHRATHDVAPCGRPLLQLARAARRLGGPARPAPPGTSPPLTDLQLLNDGELAMLGDVIEVLERRIQLAEAHGIDITRLSNRTSDHS